MKFSKLLGTAAIVFSAAICIGCSSTPIITDDGKDSSNNQNQEVQSFGKYGMGLDVNEKFYFWKFTADDMDEGGLFATYSQTDDSFVELVCLDGDTETVVRSVETASEFAANEKGLYYNSGEAILFMPYGSEKETHCDFGEILGITENGKFVIYSKDDSTLCAIDTSDNSSKILYENTRFVKINENAVYHTPIEESGAASKGLISLYSADPETNTGICLFTSDGNLYDGESRGEVNISKIVFRDDYVYFSYGAVGGSGAFFQGGDVVRAKKDGSGSEVLVDFSVENVLTDGNFVVLEDGSVLADSEYEAFHSNLEETGTERGIITYNEPGTGKPLDICSYKHDPSYDSSSVSYISITDKYVFFVTHYGTYVPEKNMGWRDYYSRDKSIFRIYNRETLTYFYSYEF